MNFNLLDLNNDILNIIGYYVKKDNLERKIIRDRQLRLDRQIINGKEIRFYHFFYWSLMCDLKIIIHRQYILYEQGISKDIIKKYLFDNINDDIKHLKVYARVDKIKLTKSDLRMCIWVCFQRYKLIFNNYNNEMNSNIEMNLNIEDENNYLDEYFRLKKINLKKKNYSFNY